MPFYTGLEQGPGLVGARATSRAAAGSRTSGCRRRCRRSRRTFSDAGMAGLYDNGAPATTRRAPTRSAGSWARTCATAGSHGIDRLLNVLVITDDDVEAQNRVTLSTTLPPDEHGPVAAGRVPPARRGRRARSATASILAAEAVELLRAAGAEKVYRIGWPPLILHVQSTMRMGTDAVRLGARRERRGALRQAACSSPTTRRWPTRSAAPTRRSRPRRSPPARRRRSSSATSAATPGCAPKPRWCRPTAGSRGRCSAPPNPLAGRMFTSQRRSRRFG